MNTQILEGKELPIDIAKQIYQILLEAFGESENGKKRKPDYSDRLMFILRDDADEICAVGGLKTVKVLFRGKEYEIHGIGGVVAVRKGNGCGKVLMQAIIGYLEKEDLNGVGFCTRFNTPFYEKCGFNVERDLLSRFVKKEVDGSLSIHPDEDDEDVLYIEGKDEFMNEVLEYSKEKVYVPFFW